MKNIYQGLVLALSMLTTLPFLKVHTFFKGINGYAVMFYPIVGLVLGSILLAISYLLSPFLEQTHIALIILALWVALTGALHLDGLSDTIDALFVKKSRREEVLKDPHIGAMGVHFSVIFLLLKASALWHLDALYLLPFVMMLSRYNVVLVLKFLPYSRKSGMATLAKSEFTTKQFYISTVFIISTAIFFNTLTVLALILISLTYLWLISKWLRKKFGELSGDSYGFIIETTELLLLHVLLIGISL